MATATAARSCRHHHCLSHNLHSLFSSPSRANTLKSHQLRPSTNYPSIRHPSLAFSATPATAAAGHSQVSDGNSSSSSSSFTWDDVFRVAQGNENDDPRDLQGFFSKVHLNNRNSEKQCEFIPFVVDDQIVGYVHHGFADQLRKFDDVFIFPKDSTYGSQFGCHVTLNPVLREPEDRTTAVGGVIECLGGGVIPGIRNEFYPVTPYHGAPACFSLERAAAPYFGIKAYGVHMNGYVERKGEKFLWVGKRSNLKATYPGMLDHLVAGGLPHGISCHENLVKECAEEAGISRSVSEQAKAVGAVSYVDINGYRLKRDVLFCYDLKLPDDFVPHNEDKEVESFRLIPIEHVGTLIRRTDFYKANCTLVIVDFLFRHGYITPESFGYLKLLQSLRNGECS